MQRETIRPNYQIKLSLHLTWLSYSLAEALISHPSRLLFCVPPPHLSSTTTASLFTSSFSRSHFLSPKHTPLSFAPSHSLATPILIPSLSQTLTSGCQTLPSRRKAGNACTSRLSSGILTALCCVCSAVFGWFNWHIKNKRLQRMRTEGILIPLSVPSSVCYDSRAVLGKVTFKINALKYCVTF